MKAPCRECWDPVDREGSELCDWCASTPAQREATLRRPYYWLAASIALIVLALLSGCATACPPPPGPPVWALATVPDDATYNSQVLYLIAENAQREAYGDSLLALLAQCRR